MAKKRTVALYKNQSFVNSLEFVFIRLLVADFAGKFGNGGKQIRH